MIDKRKLPSTYYGKQLCKELTRPGLGTIHLQEPFPLWAQRSDPERFGTDARLPYVLSAMRHNKSTIMEAAFKQKLSQMRMGSPYSSSVEDYKCAAEKAKAVVEQATLYLNSDKGTKLDEEFTGYSFVNHLCLAGENAGYEL